MDAIKDIIPRVIAPLSEGKTQSMDIAERWQRACGDGKNARAVSFKDGILTVHVDCSARIVHMNTYKADYTAKLNQEEPKVKDIRFKVGKI